MLIILVKMFVLGALLRWQDSSGEPHTCAIIYTALTTFAWILTGASFGGILLHALLAFGISAMYFYALEYMAGGPIHWIILAVGFLLLLAI